MKTKIAVAMALVVAGVGLSLPSVDTVRAQSSNRPVLADFQIADSESSANLRNLGASSEEIGSEDVSAGSPETLHVRLETANDQLDWTVFHRDANDECVKYDLTNCERTIDQKDEEQTCDLDAPNSGSKTYWVKFENPEGDSLQYMTWSS